MSKTFTFEIQDEVYEALKHMAKREGRSVDVLVLEYLAKHFPKPPLSEKERKAADKQLLKYAGVESLGYPTGADNESIDADLAREYGSSREAWGSVLPGTQAQARLQTCLLFSPCA